MDISVGTANYMLPSNFNLIIEKTDGYNNIILIRNIEMKVGLNRNIIKIEADHHRF